MPVLQKLEEWFVVILLCIMAILAFYQVVTRYVLTSLGLPWIEEMVRHFFVAITFIGAAIVLRKKGHQGVEILSQILPSRIKPYHQLYVDACSLVFSLAAFYASIQLILRQRAIGILTSATRFPVYVITIPIAIGFILMVYYVSKDLIVVLGDLLSRKGGRQQ
jgi:TRAP-type C4-dicarboxylate transport system permease small subunit